MKKNINRIIRDFSALFIICNVGSVFFPFPPLVWRLGLTLLAVISIFLSRSQRTKVEKCVIVFTILNLIYFVFAAFEGTASTTQIGNILCAMLSLCLYAHLGRVGVMTDGFITIVSVALTIVGIYAFYYNQAFLLDAKMLDDDAGAVVTNNMSSIFLMIIPLLFYVKKDYIKIAILAVCVYYLLLGAKRGNILASVIPIFFLIWQVLRGAHRSIGKYLLVILACAVLAIFAYNWGSSNDYLMHRWEQTQEGNSSGRDVIYAHAWQLWSESDNIWNLLFGYGYDATLYQPIMQRMHAHCDWLEILVDYGFIGVIFYLVLFIRIYRFAISCKSYKRKIIILASEIAILFKSFYSMGFNNDSMAIMMIALGTAIGRKDIDTVSISGEKTSDLAFSPQYHSVEI